MQNNYFNLTNFTPTIIKLEPCNINDFYADVHSVYKELELDNFLCFPKDFSILLKSN